MKHWLTLLCLCSVSISIAQPYGNEWINYDQPYYHFKIWEQGIYRIDVATLQNAGIPTGSIDPRNIQIFVRENEIPVYIEGENDGTFDSGDFIEFYGEKNDGWLDAQIYEDPSYQNNANYSLYNDTIHYFLTWNNQLNNARIVVEEDVNFNAYPITDFILKKKRIDYFGSYYFGELNAFNGSLPYYGEGEGWFGSRFGFPFASPTFNSSFSLDFLYQGVGAPSVRVKAAEAGVSNASTQIIYNHHLQVVYNSPEVIAADIKFTGFKLNTFDFNIPIGDVSSSLQINFKVVDDIDIEADYHAVSYVEVEYPRTLNFGGSSKFEFNIPYPNNSNKSRLEIENLQGSSPILYAFDQQIKRIPVIEETGVFKALVPKKIAAVNMECFITSLEDVFYVNQISKVSVSGFFEEYASLNIDSAFLVITHESLMNEAQLYSGYRSQDNPLSNENLNGLVIDVADIYLQFGGGIDKCSFGIRRFCDYVLDSWNTPPQYLFLLGKSIREAREGTIAGSRQHEGYYKNNLVPSFGFPSSDNLFTSGLNNTLIEPAIPTGRLSAKNGAEVIDYLGKVFELEHQPLAEWMKNVAHFGGGNTFNEQEQFAYYLSNYESIVEDSLFGGNVFTFLKNSSLPIQINLSDSISEIIENGLTIMTFFGHASGNGFDQSIDNPANLQWNGHYPLVIGNACFTGDIHQPTSTSTSEDYVLLQEKGAIGFLSTVKLGFSGNLNQYSNEFYVQFSRDNYGGSLGSHIKKTIKNIQGSEPSDLVISTALGMTLHGDPSIVLYSPDLPDLSIVESQVYFSPQQITAQVDSFKVNVVLTNLGKTTDESFSLELIRQFPDGSDSSYFKTIDGLNFKDTITFKLQVDPSQSIGLNTFDIYVDQADLVNEESELNNSVINKPLLITTGGVIPVYPYEFAVIPDPSVTLKASTGNPFASATDYVFQLDTNDKFDSPFMLEHNLNQSGGVLNWQPEFVAIDSTVYYWRVSADNTNGQDFEWRESSFQYVEDRVGWGQAHFPQFKKDQFNQIDYNYPERKFEFFSGSKNLRCVVNPQATGQTNYYIDLDLGEYDGCGFTPALHVAVIDSLTLEPWGTYFTSENPDHDFGNLNNNGACRNRVEYYFIFRQNDADQMLAFQNMIENEIPDGHFVLIYTWRMAQYGNWTALNPEIFNTFSNLGATEIGVGQDSVPFIFAVKKGHPETKMELVGNSLSDVLTMNYPLPTSGESGIMESTVIGPARSWNSLHWDSYEMETNGSDSTIIQVIGINEQGVEVELNELRFDVSVENVPDLFNLIEASTYPRIKLKALMIDTSAQTPTQLKRWQVLYQPVPEAALNASLGYYFYNDSLEEGEEMKFNTAIENISEWNMDSLLVYYWIEKSNREIIRLPYPLQDSLKVGEIILDSIAFDTRYFPGLNTIWIEANPVDTTTGQYHQAEQYHFNNIAQIPFYVHSDRINPILDVTFDGLHIINGEIISAKPEIVVRLDDENPYLIMNEPEDTAFFKVFLTRPGSEPERVYFVKNGLEVMQFIPATGANNESFIYYYPTFEEDGEYELLVVAADKSRNPSGNMDYQISFDVINEATITEVLNYPNPFSTKTHFVFTLTGSDVPDYIRIQIMTVTGKVVKEIHTHELGALRVGRNITEYFWDGTDQYGDQLANGIYLYRVYAKLQGKDISKRESNADNYFHKGFGKMYLMR